MQTTLVDWREINGRSFGFLGDKKVVELAPTYGEWGLMSVYSQQFSEYTFQHVRSLDEAKWLAEYQARRLLHRFCVTPVDEQKRASFEAWRRTPEDDARLHAYDEAARVYQEWWFAGSEDAA